MFLLVDSIEASGLNEYSLNDKEEWVRPSGIRINVERMWKKNCLDWKIFGMVMKSISSL